jgi:hypothetical protein
MDGSLKQQKYFFTAFPLACVAATEIKAVKIP